MDEDSHSASKIELDYEIEECSLMFRMEEEPPPPPEPPKEEETPEGIMLEPDHPLLARFQLALKQQLERQVTKLSEEVAELEIGIKNKTTERDALGVSVYDAQQMVNLQQKNIEHCENEIKKITKEREEMEEEFVGIKEVYLVNRNTLNEAEKKELELRSELETMNFMMQQMTSWEERLHSDLVVHQRISDKAKIDKKQFAEEKRNLDFLIYKLMTEVFRLENSLEHSEMQLRVKEQEREDFANSIARANADIEFLETEHKRLMHSWNCVLVAIGHRDKMFNTTKLELEKEQEVLRNTLVEISSAKKMSAEAMVRNEQLTLIKGRIDSDKITLLIKLNYEKDKLNNLEKKLMETQSINNQTSKDLDEILVEKRMKQLDMENLQREIEKYLATKSELEEKILLLLQEQITNDKISKYMNKTIRDLREKNRTQEITLASVENKLADISVTIERQKAMNEDTTRYLEDVMKQEKKQEDEVNEINNEIHTTINSIKKKQINFDVANKRYDDLLAKTGGVELSPQEIKIKTLERQIAELDDKNKKLKVFWLRQQSYIVSLKEERHSQLNEINLIRKQTMLLQQKNLKLEDELEELKKQQRIIERNTTNIKIKLDKMNEDIVMKRGQKETLDINTMSYKNEYIQKLKDMEMACIKLESDISELEDEKATLSKDLIELNREALAWERKIKMAVETKEIIAQEKSAEGEMGAMRAEIHRMTVRYSQLRKAQEKLIQDLNHCISRREFIFVNAEATEKRLSLGGKVNNRINFQRKLEDTRSKVKKTDNDIQSLENKLSQAFDLETKLCQQIKENEQTINDLEQKIIELTHDIDTAKFDRQKELEMLVYKQHKLRAFTSISKGQYRTFYRTACAVQIENLEHQEMNANLRTVVENLIIDFPNHYPLFSRILNTLKLVHIH